MWLISLLINYSVFPCYSLDSLIPRVHRLYLIVIYHKTKIFWQIWWIDFNLPKYSQPNFDYQYGTSIRQYIVHQIHASRKITKILVAYRMACTSRIVKILITICTHCSTKTAVWLDLWALMLTVQYNILVPVMQIH